MINDNTKGLNATKQWIREDFNEVLPVLINLANQNSTKTWESIKSSRTDPFTLQILKNLHYLNEGYEEEKCKRVYSSISNTGFLKYFLLVLLLKYL